MILPFIAIVLFIFPLAARPLTLDTHYHLSPKPLPPACEAPSYDSFASSHKISRSVVTQPAAMSSDHGYVLSSLSASRKGILLLTPSRSPSPDLPPTAVTTAEDYARMSAGNSHVAGARFNPALFPSSGVPDAFLRLYDHLGSPPDGYDPARPGPSHNGVASLILMSGFAEHEDLLLRLLYSSP